VVQIRTIDIGAGALLVEVLADKDAAEELDSSLSAGRCKSSRPLQGY
jgi:hypothetical protein